MEVTVLNNSDKDLHERRNPTIVSKELQKLMLRMKGDVIAENGKGIKYNEILNNCHFKEFVTLAASLQHMVLKDLSEDERKAFFITAQSALPSSVLKLTQFWKSVAYNINGHLFTLDDIEHGILRGNRPHPASQNNPFAANDPRLQFTLTKSDPRIHFALVCGAKSCPAINVYTATNLQTALDAATSSFCSQEVHIDEARKEITVSQIFQWYMKDFGPNDVTTLRWISRYLRPEDEVKLSRLLRTLETQGMVDIKYKQYDWSLNEWSSNDDDQV